VIFHKLGITHENFLAQMVQNPVREALYSASRQAGLSPSKDESSRSELVYDLTLPPTNRIDIAKYFRVLIDGKQTLILNFGSSRSGPLRVIFPQAIENAAAVITIHDQYDRLLLLCEGHQCLDSGTSIQNTRLIRITLESKAGTKDGEPFWITLSPSKRHEEVLPKSGAPIAELELDLNFSQEHQFKWLTKVAHKRGEDGLFSFPKNKTRARIRLDDRESEVKVAISGRTPGHFLYPPSMAILVTTGPTILGSKKFRLYRADQKMGVFDFVGLTMLAELGVPAPVQRLVSLTINGEQHGLYIFEPDYSPSYFEELSFNESVIIGTDSNEFFKDYPLRVRLRPSTLYRKSLSVADRYDKSTPEIGRPNFVHDIDRVTFAKLIAFLILFHGSHGLGTDDLRFIFNEMTGKYYPIARDLNLTDWAEPQFKSKFIAYEAHLSLLNKSKLISLLPFTSYSSHPDPMSVGVYQDGPTVGFRDFHPSVLYFLNKTANQELVGRYLLEMVSAGWPERFISRVKTVLEAASESFLATGSLQALLEDQYSRIQLANHIHVSGLVEESKGNGRLFLDIDHANNTATLTNTFIYPVRILVQGDTPFDSNCSKVRDAFLLGSFLNSTPYGEVADHYVLLSNKIDKSLETTATRFSNHCRFASASIDILLNNLDFSLPDGTSVSPRQIVHPTAPPLRSDIRLDQSVDLRALISLWKVDDFIDHQLVHYAVHLSSPLFNQTVSPASFFKLYDLGEGAPSAVFSTSATDFSDDSFLPTASWITRKFPDLGAAYGNFARTSTVVTLKIRKIARDQYLYLDRREIKNFFDPTWEVHFFDPYEFVVPAIEDAPASAVRHPRPSWVRSSVDPFNPAILRLTINGGGPYVLKRKLRVAKAEHLIIEQGAHLALDRNAGILVEGRLTVNGSETDPVTFTPVHKKWGGLLISDSGESNEITHAIFQGATFYEDDDRSTFGGLTVVNSKIVVKNSSFLNFTGDDAINFYGSNAKFSQSKILGATGDGLDSDFTVGIITNSVFEGSGGDNIDLNHSFFQITDNAIEHAGDKGISVGERTNVVIQHNRITNNGVGIAVKDSSSACIKKNEITKNEIGVDTFIKKAWYAEPSITLVGNFFKSNTVPRRLMTPPDTGLRCSN
jgi:parallel beta-helix repeat protein